MSMESKAEGYMKGGDKALKKFSMFGMGGDKFEEAAEQYARAGNAFKMAKKWEKAADAYAKAADCDTKNKSEHEAAVHLIEAAHCTKHVNTSECATLLSDAVARFEDLGNFGRAAKLEKEIAEIAEADMNIEDAVAHYQKAADLFSGEDSTSAANQCLLKVAHFQAQLESYSEAVTIFEEVGTSFLDNTMLKFNAKGAFLNAGLCHLASGDPVAAERAIQRYKELDYTFSGCRECTLLENIHAAMVAFNVEDFTDHVAKYDEISKLDPWKTSMLLKIKNNIAAAGESAVDLT